MEKKKSGFGTASLVLGIIGVCTSFKQCIFYLRLDWSNICNNITNQES